MCVLSTAKLGQVALLPKGTLHLPPVHPTSGTYLVLVGLLFLFQIMRIMAEFYLLYVREYVGDIQGPTWQITKF
jgi:hypothetical protein